MVFLIVLFSLVLVCQYIFLELFIINKLAKRKVGYFAVCLMQFFLVVFLAYKFFSGGGVETVISLVFVFTSLFAFVRFLRRFSAQNEMVKIK
ncbi:hypothetical protein [Teredinibacter sp. KSP-S5-2]|uniref:hypothetical protein n=1 Tax=Teredinibacter sp. KSP-S5-2 TaxID=3034506 RepID=UPI002934368A|nr:hypothetical protein [Teredinibacter sp. KSP-S5-2]WNO10285.1 hypothetical protein P5V12_03775 [Teredinibacter sp. KSP-S5-2]